MPVQVSLQEAPGGSQFPLAATLRRPCSSKCRRAGIVQVKQLLARRLLRSRQGYSSRKQKAK
jgi:hypothetical protein